jgi:polar amino acid transport system substrate-binding protein
MFEGECCLEFRIKLLAALASVAFLMTIGVGTGVASAASPSCEPARLGTKYPGLVGKTIKVTLPGDTKPIAYRDPANIENMIGFAADFARAVFGCLGVPYEFDVAPLSGGIAAVQTGRADMVWSSIYYTPERAKVLDFVIYQKAASGGVVPKGNPQKLESLADLCGHSAVAQLGSLEAVTLQNTSQACTSAGKPAVNVLTSPDRTGGLRLLDDGRVDLYLGIGLKQAYPDNVALAFIYTSDIKVGVGITKGAAELEKAVAESFAALQASGAERKIYEKYEIDPTLSLPPYIVTE